MSTNNNKKNNNSKKVVTSTTSTSTSSSEGYQRGSNVEFRSLHKERQQQLKRKEREVEQQSEGLDIDQTDKRISKVKKLEKAAQIVSSRIKEKGTRSRFDVDDQDNILLDDKQLLRTKKSDRYQNPDTLKKKRELKKKEKMSAADHNKGDSDDKKKDDLTDEQDAEADKLIPFLPKTVKSFSTRLYSSDIYAGMVLLGAFEMVTDSFIVVSLPFGIRGYVKFNEISDEFTKWSNSVMKDNIKYKSNFQKTDSILERIKTMFIKGHLLKVAVMGISDMKKKGLLCTLRPEVINKESNIGNFTEGMNIYGSVQSVQDKGYIISFGSGFEHKGFLKFEDTKFYWPTTTSNVDASTATETTLSVGQPLECNILTISESPKIVSVSVSHFLVSRATTKDSTAITAQSIKAGMLVEGTISAVYDNGLQVRFLEFFAGDIHQFHVDRPLTDFQEGRTLKARIISVDHEKKRIHLSLLSHCLGLRPFPFNTLKIGDIFHKDIIVKKVDTHEILLSLPDEFSKVKGLLHNTQTENNKESLKGKFNVGSELHVPCRVKHVDYLDAMVTLTTKKKEIGKTIYSYYDLQPGQILDGTIKFVRDDSIEIKITDNIFGVVPMHNLGETMILKPRERFNAGQSLRFRILKVVPEKKRLVLTLKPSLVHSTLPILSSKAACKVGEIAQGFISRIEDERIHVTFFGDVHGIVDRSQMSRTPITMISEHFQIGQVVTTKTLQVNPKGLFLTLIIDNADYQQYLNSIQNNKNQPEVKDEENEEEEEEEEESEEESEEEEKVEVKKEEPIKNNSKKTTPPPTKQQQNNNNKNTAKINTKSNYN
ncbi:hypothetical protein DFA_05377 [Cavenderia fasciculata]|uniref:S1 motif domain-containing protein n=1 Tax=Cavenderia fasciculata TaxID=261658 RepID=F4PL23_CACFS|nr:uncharacterized protein DFA_05377 [Cavenderia fasciculata]EGG23245.1 hypothetical protein DFA_05377 [Cavenderia fasciculata]|eukprot:XP_004361096.1 hypothetical protein DFA_05377 [Cavenderia fasciculata]